MIDLLFKFLPFHSFQQNKHKLKNTNLSCLLKNKTRLLKTNDALKPMIVLLNSSIIKKKDHSFFVKFYTLWLLDTINFMI